MRAEDVRIVLLARAFEEADGEGVLLSPRERSEAADSAEARTGPGESLLIERARTLLERVGSRTEGVERALTLGATDVPYRWLILGIAFVVGLATAAFGSGRFVHLLQAPILVLIALNVGVYVLLALRWTGLVRGPVQAAREALAALAGRVGSAAAKRLGSRAKGRTAVAADAYAAFAGLWARAAGGLLVARAARILHLAAALLMIGAIFALYARGMAHEFRMVWESTFLDDSQVEAILRIVLAPGLAVLGGELGSIASFHVDVADGAGSPAARWAHLYAISAVVWVVLPRLVLAGFASWRGARLERNLELDPHDPYLRRLLSRGRGESEHVQILPYSHTPTARARDRLAELLRDVFGTRAVTSTAPSTAYGDELPETSKGAALVALFTLAQTPEYEVHGAFLQSARDRVRKNGSVLVLIDASSYRARLGGGEEADRRVRERRVAWSRHVGDAGLTAIHVDLSEDGDDSELADAVAGVWPKGSVS